MLSAPACASVVVVGADLRVGPKFRNNHSRFDARADTQVRPYKTTKDSLSPPAQLHQLTQTRKHAGRYRADQGKGSYATLDQLIAQGMVEKEMLENYGYKIELKVSGDKFAATAVPAEYNKTGRLSYFVDESSSTWKQENALKAKRLPRPDPSKHPRALNRPLRPE